MHHTLLIIGVFLIAIYMVYTYFPTKEAFSGPDEYKNSDKYKKQVQLLTDMYSGTASARRPVSELLAKNIMPDAEQNFVNFYALGCRFTGYIGPMKNGFFDPNIAVQAAVNSGCRVFILEIDYIDKCHSGGIAHYPRLVVRDIQGKLITDPSGETHKCNTADHSNIKDVCSAINNYAFASSCQNASDPVVIVLYFLRKPLGAFNSTAVLDYYSAVAKSLVPFQDRLLKNEIAGGMFNRQKQEGQLLINNITNYNGKVLIFSNANTSGFRGSAYATTEDLDYFVNMRLSYRQTQLGITENNSGSTFGTLETAEDFLIIPSDRISEMVEQTKMSWTACFSKDPSQIVSQGNYHTILSNYGVNCIPIQLFDANNQYVFTDTTFTDDTSKETYSFKKYSFIPKPEALRYVKPPVVIPAQPNTVLVDAKGGHLRSPI